MDESLSDMTTEPEEKPEIKEEPEEPEGMIYKNLWNFKLLKTILVLSNLKKEIPSWESLGLDQRILAALASLGWKVIFWQKQTQKFFISKSFLGTNRNSRSGSATGIEGQEYCGQGTDGLGKNWRLLSSNHSTHFDSSLGARAHCVPLARVGWSDSCICQTSLIQERVKILKINEKKFLLKSFETYGN